MESTWQEMWSLGSGRSRTYCALSRTEDGYAVDLFHGDTCLEASYFATEADATSAAHALRFRYGVGGRASRVALAVMREKFSDLSAALTSGSASFPACSARRR